MKGVVVAEPGPPGFAEFVQARYAALARSAYLLTGDRGHAEDLVQSALVVTLNAWPRLSSLQAAEPYARTTMVRLSRRWAKRRWRLEQPTATDSLVLLATPLPAADSAAAMDLQQVLSFLPWEQRAVLVLRYFDDLSERETAAVLGCSEGTVKSRASRALTKLRESGLISPEDRDG